MTLIEAVLECGFAITKAEARRKIEQGGVKVNGNIWSHPWSLFNVSETVHLTLGRTKEATFMVIKE